MLNPAIILRRRRSGGNPFADYIVGGYTPSMVLDFANETYLGTVTSFDDLTYSGASNKTFADSDGVLKWAPHNLFARSEAITTSPWVFTADTFTPGYDIAPDGVSAVHRFHPAFVTDPGAVAATRRAHQNTGLVYAGHRYGIALNVKPVNAQSLYVGNPDGGDIDTDVNLVILPDAAECRVYVNMRTFAVTVSGAGAGTTAATVTALSDEWSGWHRIEIAYTATITDASNTVIFAFSNRTTQPTFDPYPSGEEDILLTQPSTYRIDLGGMTDNPATGDSYVPTTTAARYLPRRGHHIHDGSAWVNAGLLLEPTAATNLLLNSGTLATQDVTTTAVAHTLSFTGTGTVTLTGTSTAGPLVGTGTGENNRVSLTFTPTAGTLTLTVSGTVTNAQLEIGSAPSSYIATAEATVTRAAETLTAALDAGTYDVRVVLDTGTTDLTSVAHGGGAYWPTQAKGNVARVIAYPEGALA